MDVKGLTRDPNFEKWPKKVVLFTFLQLHGQLTRKKMDYASFHVFVLENWPIC